MQLLDFAERNKEMVVHKSDTLNRMIAAVVVAGIPVKQE